MNDLKCIQYVIVDLNQNPLIGTVQPQRKTCINKFLEGSNVSWEKAKSIGWQCKKVSVSITNP